MDKVTWQCPQTTAFLKRKESGSGIQPRSFRLSAKRKRVPDDRSNVLKGSVPEGPSTHPRSQWPRKVLDYPVTLAMIDAEAHFEWKPIKGM